MARTPGYRVSGGGVYVPNAMGYREVLNGRVTLSEMQTRGEVLAASAARQSGIDYVVDSQQGLNRIHTRVSTPPGSVNGRSPYLRERALRALAVVAAEGGSTNATLQQALNRVSKSTDRGWKAIAGNRLKWSTNAAKRGSK